MTPKLNLVPARELAKQLGLPLRWLAEEAKEGRLPSLRIGRRLFFHEHAVKEALLERATTWGADKAPEKVDP
jgi:excisionase family DNA binding protein